MNESPYAKMRGKPRFRAGLKAMYCVEGDNFQRQQCRITNLSQSGAGVRLARNERFRPGAVLRMDIAIPGTLMHVPVEAEVIWTGRRANELLAGIRFAFQLSDSMLLELTAQKSSVAHPPQQHEPVPKSKRSKTGQVDLAPFRPPAP